MFVVLTEKGYLAKTNRSFTDDINLAKLFTTQRSARAVNSMAICTTETFEIVPVKVTVEKV